MIQAAKDVQRLSKNREVVRKIPLFGGAALIWKRTQKHDEILFASPRGMTRLTTLPHPRSLQLADIRNDAFDAGNLYEIKKICEAKREGRAVVLYVIRELTKTGGIERRLELQFAWLAAHGVQPVIVCERQEYAPLAGYPTLRFFSWAPGAGEKLLELIRWTGASAVEFNNVPREYPIPLDVEALKAWTRVGCMIHSAAKPTEDLQRLLDSFDYRCTSDPHAHEFRNFDFVPNVVDFPEIGDFPGVNIESRRALYVGRICDEKLPSVRNFVDLCGRHGIDCEIAGPVAIEKGTSKFLSAFPRDRLLGAISTRRFLKERGSEYLFIAGVAQVPLEAAAAGFPALVAPHAGDSTRSVFLARDNLSLMRSWNCTIKKMPQELAPGNAGEFFEAVEKARKSGGPESLGKFLVRRELEETLSADKVWGRYRDIMLGEDRDVQ